MQENILKDINEYLNKTFANDKFRLDHIYAVRDVALSIGMIYGGDPFKLEVAALLHDATKNDGYDKTYKILQKNFSDNDISKIPLGCLHAYSASILAENTFKITDQDILNAIMYHCSGRKTMSLTEEIIYVSDYLDETRGKERIPLRDLVKTDLNLTTYKILIETRNYLLEKKQSISDLTIQAIDYYKRKVEAKHGK